MSETATETQAEVSYVMSADELAEIQRVQSEADKLDKVMEGLRQQAFAILSLARRRLGIEPNAEVNVDFKTGAIRLVQPKEATPPS